MWSRERSRYVAEGRWRVGSYDGEWRQGKKHGQGTMEWSDLSRCVRKVGGLVRQREESVVCGLK